MSEKTWMPEARQFAAQCWCDEETKHLVMDPVLAEAVARRIAVWMETGAQHAGNESFWHDKVRELEAEVERAHEALRDREKNELSALADLDDAKAEVEKLRAERDAARKEAAKWERAAHRAADHDPDEQCCQPLGLSFSSRRRLGTSFSASRDGGRRNVKEWVEHES